MNGPRPSRRTLLKAGATLGLVGTLPTSATAQEDDEPVTSPQYLAENKWQDPLPFPAVKQPSGKRRGADYYSFTIEPTTQQLHPMLPKETKLWGYDGSYPGPTIDVRQNERVKVEFDNTPLGESHLFTVDDRIHGTKTEHYSNFDDFTGPVPEVRTTTHAHGLHVEPDSDGLPEAWKGSDGTWGPRRKRDVLDYPNRQTAATLFYHDHALGITRLNVYAGLAGFYLIRSDDEEDLNLPDGPQEVPVLIQDRTFKPEGHPDEGDLHYPDVFAAEFGGDTAVVNGKVWPYLEVEPRRYRFRYLNGSNGRTFNLALANETTTEDDVPMMYQIGVDLGFLPEPVTVGPVGSGAQMSSITLSGAERADVVIDFSEHAGETITVTNDAEFPYIGENLGVTDGDNGHFAALDEILQFQVKDVDPPADDSADPSTLDLPAGPEFKEAAARETRQMTLDSRGVDGLDTHLLNDSHWGDESAVVRCQRGATEIWELKNNTPDSHPIHLHLVEFQVLDRIDHATGNSTPPDPNELGDKDTVRINPDETVRIITRIGDFTGRYVWHCHILEHEDQEMMLPFEVVNGPPDK